MAKIEAVTLLSMCFANEMRHLMLGKQHVEVAIKFLNKVNLLPVKE